MNRQDECAVNDSRFAFGKNWQRFLSVLDESRIVEAEKSLREMLKVDHLRGKTFLDIGSGSGLFSLAARRLGATVLSFDYDEQSVACTRHLKQTYFENDDRWTVTQGSVLDERFMQSLGEFDIVYAWGVLHHTGQMWRAMELAGERVVDTGRMFIMIYPDRGWKSELWKKIKRFHCSSSLAKAAVLGFFVPYFATTRFLGDLLRARNPTRRYKDYKRKRGMSIWYDWMDWLGGYPYEFSEPQDVIDFCAERGFVLNKLKGTRRECPQYVFQKLRQREVVEQSDTAALRAAS